MAVDFDNLNAAELRLFGESMTFSPLTGDAESVNGIDLRTPILEESTPGNVVRVWIKATDVSQVPARGDGWTMDSTDFIIEAVDEDGAGGLFLSLRKTA